MSDHVESREFNVRLDLRCVFPESYDGEEDGYEWARELPALTSEIVAAVVGVLRKHPEWRLRTGNRGRPSDEELTIVAERLMGDGAPTATKAP